ncbi:hypothetical protein V6Z11_D02G052100 [Gossypium hirsutum]
MTIRLFPRSGHHANPIFRVPHALPILQSIGKMANWDSRKDQKKIKVNKVDAEL